MSRETPGVFVKISLPDRAGAKTRTAALRSTPLYLLDTDNFKKLIFWCLSPEGEESERISFHAQTDAGYLHQIASEHLVQDKKGAERWERIHKDNHFLDCLVGHKAMAHWQWQPSLAHLARKPQTVFVDLKSEENPFTGGNSLLEVS